MPAPEALAALAQIIDPSALCRFVGKRLDYSTANCDHTFKHTLAFMAPYARRAGRDPDAVLDLIRQLGADCDCEFGLNVCGRYVNGA